MGHLILNSNYNRFSIQFDRGFFPDTVRQKYRRLINRTPDVFQEVEDLIEFSIQGITISGINASTVEQSPSQASWARTFKQGKDVLQLEDGNRQLSIAFKYTNDYLNYFALCDTIISYWEYGTKKNEVYKPSISLNILDRNGYITLQYRFNNIILNNIDDFMCSYTSNVAEFKNFNVGLEYQYFDIIDYNQLN
jgi:hypothetical protein